MFFTSQFSKKYAFLWILLLIAGNNAVLLLVSTLLTSAPFSISNRTIFSCPVYYEIDFVLVIIIYGK